jgi:hypothetical protein
MGRTVASCRQLALRARQHIDQRRQRFDADLRQGQELTRAFVTACGTGDLNALLALLSDDVVVWTAGVARSGPPYARWWAAIALPAFCSMWPRSCRAS